MHKQFVSFLLVLASWQTAFGLYFHIAETERKCFIEEVPDETTVIGMVYNNIFGNLLTL